jgi:N-acetylmuramoyl-L-alanine amidase
LTKRALAPLVLVFSLAPSSAHGASAPTRVVPVSEELTAILLDDAITVEVRPFPAENPAAFARRVTKDEATALAVLRADAPTRERPATLPYAALSNELKRAAVAALFPSDLRATAGWLHIAVADEGWGSVGEWFGGTPALAGPLAHANGKRPGERIARGTTVRIPTEYLLVPFRDAEAIGEDEPVKLEYGADEKGRYAIYRLKRKEALYSSVVVRFTGRLHAEDVVQLALKIAVRSNIDDVHAIPVGYPIKIPLDTLTAEWLPKDDPRAQELANEKAEASQFAAPAPAKGLKGVRVVLDAGHGGRDTGTLHEGIWESTYVYDVACRLRKILAERTLAEVVMTTKEPGVGWQIENDDRIANRRARLLLTTPPYRLDDPVVGVNLRWYLANALLKKPGSDKKKIPPERTVFISLHADSLHPSVRGAMAYVPGERFMRDRFGKTAAVYKGFKEFRDAPTVSFGRLERVESEGVSTGLAEKLITAMRDAGLPVHRFSPVRTHVIRAGREWVPAVLRYNRIPNRVLLEIANLGNEEDRALTTTRRFRQEVAGAIASGLVDFFGGREKSPPVSFAADAGQVQGPLPAVAGPWPERAAEKPAPERKPVKAARRARKVS